MFFTCKNRSVVMDSKKGLAVFIFIIDTLFRDILTQFAAVFLFKSYLARFLLIKLV